MFYYFVYGFFGIIFLLIIAQIIEICLGFRKANNCMMKCYSDEVIVIGQKMISHIKEQKIKKQLLSEATYSADNLVLEHYIDFVENSTLYSNISHIKESRYLG